MLHFSLMDDVPTQDPPKASLMIFSLVLVLTPPPHVFEHSPYFQSSHLQSTRIWQRLICVISKVTALQYKT